MMGESVIHEHFADIDVENEPNQYLIELLYRDTPDENLRARCAKRLAEMIAPLVEVQFSRIEQNYLDEARPTSLEGMRHMTDTFGDLVQKLEKYDPHHASLSHAKDYYARLLARMKSLQTQALHVPNDGLMKLDDKAYEKWLAENPDVTK